MSSSVACLAAVGLAIGCLQPSALSKDQLEIYIWQYGKSATSRKYRSIGVKEKGKNIRCKDEAAIEGVTRVER